MEDHMCSAIELRAHLAAPCPAYHSPEFLAYVGQNKDKFGTASSGLGALIFEALRTNESVYALLTHVRLTPDLPAVLAVEALLADRFGDDAFTDDMKQLAGWRVRQIIEFAAGRWIRAGVRIRGSRYRTGSTYEMPPF